MKKISMSDSIDIGSEKLNKLRGISEKIDKLIDICQEEWEGNDSRIGSFDISLDEEYALTIQFSPRFHFQNSKNLQKIMEIISDDEEIENFINMEKNK